MTALAAAVERLRVLERPSFIGARSENNRGARAEWALRAEEMREPAEDAAARQKRRTAPSTPRRNVVARIYRPARSVMQAGRANSRHWVLEFEPSVAPEIEPLMGWTSSRDTRQQVRLTFPSREQAVAFAERQGYAYTVLEPREPRFRPKSYADNFRSLPPPRLGALSGGR